MTDLLCEYLVILQPNLADQALAEIEAVATVTQIFRPRLLLIRPDAKAKENLVQIAGVLGVYDAVPSKIPSDLSPEERVFIAAWAARCQPKTRQGEGLPWDAPGFAPPDPPTDRK